MKAARRVAGIMRETGQFPQPVLIDTNTRVILDGHHRWWAGQELGCARIPCYGVDYLEDESIRVQSRRPELTVSKEAVIDMGLSGKTYPIKTTRHIYAMPEFPDPVPLKKLIDPQK